MLYGLAFANGRFVEQSEVGADRCVIVVSQAGRESQLGGDAPLIQDVGLILLIEVVAFVTRSRDETRSL